jgi:outer membrane protein assembly factor BamB
MALRRPTWLLSLSLVPVPLQDWPTWRGPNHDGSSGATGLPAAFEKDEHVRWAAELPGPGAATPVILGERVFVSAAAEEDGVLLALCFDRASGALVWEHEAGSGRARTDGTKTRHDDRSNYASPSPVTDGERVVFTFGNGDLVACDLDGKRLWARNLQADLGEFTYQWTFGASPTFFEGRLYLPVLQRDEPVGGVGKPGNPSYLLALDPASGATVFVHERPSDARRESREAYSTAIPYVHADGRKELLVVGGDVITGHAPSDGSELWRWGTWNEGHREEWWRVVPSPVVGAGIVLVCAPKRAPVYALALGGAGTLDASAVKWKSSGRPNRISSDVPTPLFLDGRFFVLSDVEQALSALEPATGKVIWSLDLPERAPWEASPTGADGKIFLLNHEGLALVVDAASGKLLDQAELGEEDAGPIRSSIAIAHGALFVRTERTLRCIAQ